MSDEISIKLSVEVDDDDELDNSIKAPRSEPKALRHIDDGTDRSVSSRESIRKQLQAEVEQFLRSGGTVQTVDPHVTADPPTKPISNYGGRPI